MGGNIVKGGCAEPNNNWRTAAASNLPAAGIPLAEALGLGRELPQLLFTGEDAEEGLTACAEKCAASSKGK